MNSEMGFDRRCSTGAWLAEDEEIEATVSDADSEVDGRHRPFLADDSF
jgi:hypothetical protein